MPAIAADISPELVEAETAFLKAWPALETHWDGAWVWRFARGYTKRANSIQCQELADDGDAEARLHRLAARSREAGITPVFRQTPLAGPGIVAALESLGWTSFETSRLLYLDGLQTRHETAHRVVVSSKPGPDWIAAKCRVHDCDANTRRTLGDIIALMPDTARGLTVLDEKGTPVASTLAVAVDGLAMFTNVETSPAYRRRGYARAIMGSALDLMADLGATCAAIHVLAGNAPAEALYAGFGFHEIGGYAYRKAPPQ